MGSQLYELNSCNEHWCRQSHAFQLLILRFFLMTNLENLALSLANSCISHRPTFLHYCPLYFLLKISLILAYMTCADAWTPSPSEKVFRTEQPVETEGIWTRIIPGPCWTKWAPEGGYQWISDAVSYMSGMLKYLLSSSMAAEFMFMVCIAARSIAKEDWAGSCRREV